MKSFTLPTTDAASETQRARTTMVWVIGAFLLAAFFVFEHRNWDLSRLEGFGHTGEEMAADAAKGDPGRRLAVVAIALAGAFSCLRREGRRWELGSWLGWLLLGYYAWSTMSVCWSVDPPLTARHLGLLLLCGVVHWGWRDKRHFTSCARSHWRSRLSWSSTVRAQN